MAFISCSIVWNSTPLHPGQMQLDIAVERHTEGHLPRVKKICLMFLDGVSSYTNPSELVTLAIQA